MSAAGRLIPARAGNTVPRIWSAVHFLAHPRSRGEHDAAVIHGTNSPGSSPLTKGTQQSSVHPSVTIRLIPARAGNTVPRIWSAVHFLAHPRSRGEHRPAPGSPTSAAGSSPLARGTLRGVRPIQGRRRLIPARAGNTDSYHLVCGAVEAHPRSRGEHSSSTWSGCGTIGSSPLARGTPGAPTARDTFYRLIPARAGNTR